MKYNLILSLFLMCMAACGATTPGSDEPEYYNGGDTKCMAPDHIVNAGEGCDEVLKDCGNAICASPLVCVDSICVESSDAGMNSND
jgi:hypothetical protein